MMREQFEAKNLVNSKAIPEKGRPYLVKEASMRWVVLIGVVFLISVCGCKSIDIGGSGQVGGVFGGGGVSIPIPK